MKRFSTWTPPLDATSWIRGNYKSVAPTFQGEVDSFIRARLKAPPVAQVAVPAAVFAFLVALTPATTFWDRDEPRFAGAVREMGRTGRLLYPTFEGAVRPHKPILFYWLASLSVSAFGFSEASVRLVSAASIAVAALATGALARRLAGPEASFLAPILLAVSPLAVLEGIAATADALLLACIAVALAVFAAGRDEGFGPTRVCALALALALGLLAKGPVGLLVPVLTASGAWILDRRWGFTPQGGGALVVASLLSIAVFLAWFVPANAVTGGRFLSYGFGHEVLRRAVMPLEGHGGSYLASLPYYIPVVLVGFAPWSAFLPAAVFRLVRERSRASSVVLAWLVLTIALFSLVATKLPHYVLPIAPAIAIAVAALVAELEGASPDAGLRRWLNAGHALSAAVATLVAAALSLAAWLTPIPETRGPLIALLVLHVAAFAALEVLLFRRSWVGAARLLVVASAALEITAVWGVLHAAEAAKPVPRLAAVLRSDVASATLATLDFGEPSLTLYADRPVRHLASEDEALRWLAEPGNRVLVLPSSSLARLERRAGRLHLVATESGWNIANLRPLTLAAVTRGPS